jgi:uncharacterized protein YegL
MKQGYTHVSLVLDRSGSMSSIKTDTIGSFNEFIKGQKEDPSECTFSMIQFDDQYEVVHDFKKLADVPDLDGKTFVPRGSTALLDAIGRTINDTGKRLEKMAEADRPERNIFVILTDGQENCSKEFTKAMISDMIKHQSEKYNWQFIYLGANQDAIAEARDYGIKLGNAMTFAATGLGIDDTMKSVNCATKLYRGMSTAEYSTANVTVDAFTAEDRKKQEEHLKSAGKTI